MRALLAEAAEELLPEAPLEEPVLAAGVPVVVADAVAADWPEAPLLLLDLVAPE